MFDLRPDHFLVRNRILFILLAGFLVAPGCCITSWLVSMALPKNNLLGELVAYAVVTALSCCLMYWFGVTLWNRFRSGLAAVYLAEQMGLTPLNQSDRPVAIWYGGAAEGYRFGIITFRSYSRYTLEGESRVRFFNSLRIVLALNRTEPLGVTVHRSFRSPRKAEMFEEAFPSQENADRLGDDARQAMLEFVTRDRRTGWRSIFAAGSGMRGLTLRDRAGTNETLMNSEVFLDAAVILVHDQPDAMHVTAEQLRARLSEMIAVAKVIDE